MAFLNFRTTLIPIYIAIFIVSMLLMAETGIARAEQAAEEKSIALMPYIKGKNPESIEETMTCPYSSFCFDPESIQDGADILLTRMLQELLRKTFKGKIVPLDQARDEFELLKFGKTQITPLVMGKLLGQELKVDYIVAGNVWRFRERVGHSFSVQSPASVAFAIYLLDVQTGELIWMNNYDETQQSLFSNLFNIKAFFKQGAKWLTAEEFARFGMHEMMEDFPLK